MASSYNIFHESVPAAERVMLSRSNLFRPTLRIAATSKLLVSHVTDDNTGFNVRLMASNGIPVVTLTQVGNHYFAAPIDNANTLSKTTVADTTNAMYLVKSLYKSAKGSPCFEGAINSAKYAIQSMIYGMGRRAFGSLTNERVIYMQYRQYLDDALLRPLMEVFFGERNAIDIPMEQRQRLELVRAERDKREANYQNVMQQMKEMFTPNKWLISYLPNHGYTVQQINLGAHRHHFMSSSLMISEVTYDQVTPLIFCRTLEELPGDIRDQVFGTLTLAKMHVQSKYPETAGMYGAEPHDMLFRGKHSIISEELSAVIMGEHDRDMILISV